MRQSSTVVAGVLEILSIMIIVGDSVEFVFIADIVNLVIESVGDNEH